METEKWALEVMAHLPDLCSCSSNQTNYAPLHFLCCQTLPKFRSYYVLPLISHKLQPRQHKEQAYFSLTRAFPFGIFQL
jgi:hypothetical protein